MTLLLPAPSLLRLPPFLCAPPTIAAGPPGLPLLDPSELEGLGPEEAVALLKARAKAVAERAFWDAQEQRVLKGLQVRRVAGERGAGKGGAGNGGGRGKGVCEEAQVPWRTDSTPNVQHGTHAYTFPCLLSVLDKAATSLAPAIVDAYSCLWTQSGNLLLAAAPLAAEVGRELADLVTDPTLSARLSAEFGATDSSDRELAERLEEAARQAAAAATAHEADGGRGPATAASQAAAAAAAAATAGLLPASLPGLLMLLERLGSLLIEYGAPARCACIACVALGCNC